LRTVKIKIMERIVIEVDDNVAKAFRNVEKAKQKIINDTINLWLKKATNDLSYEKYSRLLDALSDEAAKNGLTPEILGELLKEDD
jgi:Holliday junction resolvase-like predicted endonuclease